MSKQANPMAIGGFVLGAVALSVTAILVFGSGALFKRSTELVTYFPGTVLGLNVGARVDFQGVQIGQVTAIKLDFYPEERRFRIPVYFELWPDNLRFIGGTRADDPRPILTYLVEERGLRTRLESASLVTGQYLVSLKFRPDTPLKYQNLEEGRIEIPSVAATRDRIADMLHGLHLDQLVETAIEAFRGIEELVKNEQTRSLVSNADATLAEAKKLIAHIDAQIEPLAQRMDSTFADYGGLARRFGKRLDTLADSIEATSAEIKTLTRHIDREVGPISQSAVAAFNRANKAFRSVDDLVGEGSYPRHNLDRLLEEAAGAARSLRLLADYIEQNPDALIKGKY
jgi:paraquat-inducible protein B